MGGKKSKEKAKGQASSNKPAPATTRSLKEMAAKGINYIIEDTNDLGVLKKP